MVPRFGSDNVRANMNNIYGVTFQENCNDNEIDFTYGPPMAQDYVYP